MRGLEAIRKSHVNEAMRYTKKQMAALLGVSLVTYDKIERDPGRLTRSQAEKLADYLGCHVDEIFLPSNPN